MKEIPLSQGKVALVDDSDYEWLMRAGPWYACRNNRTWYAMCSLVVDGKQALIGMHTAILGTFRNKGNALPDHEDGNGLNNQRCNLRRATPVQNAANRRKRSDGITSQFKGVSVWKDHPGWFYAAIKRKRLGRSRIEEEAARMYDRAAIREYGQFASLNFPEEMPDANQV